MLQIHLWVRSCVGTVSIAADDVKQDGAELSAHEAVDDNVDRRVESDHEVDGDECVVQHCPR